METIQEFVRVFDIHLPKQSELSGLVQYQPTQPHTLRNILAKRKVLRLLYRSKEVIQRVVREAIADAAADNIRYLELRFSPTEICKAQAFSLENVMDWVLQATQHTAKEYNIRVNLLACINRQESMLSACQVADLAVDRMGEGMVGLDLEGNENLVSNEAFAKIFQRAGWVGLHTTIHAGEWQNGDQITQAIQLFQAERVGHGLHVLESNTAQALAREHDVAFEVCLTSNLQSGAIIKIKAHPLKEMITEGLKITLNTDSPAIHQTNLSQEYQLAAEKLAFDQALINTCILNAARAAFLPREQTLELVNTIENQLP